MIVKTVVFQIVNYFASLFFIAFFKPIYFYSLYDSDNQDGINEEVLSELQIQLGMLFITLITVQNVKEILLATFLVKLRGYVWAEQDLPPHTTEDGQPQIGSELGALGGNNLGEAYSPFNIGDLQKKMQNFK